MKLKAVKKNGELTEFIGRDANELKRLACRWWANNAATRPGKEHEDVWPNIAGPRKLSIVDVRVSEVR